MTKKIDFHIHTVSSIKDSDFSFSLDWLRKYVENTELDSIAITNHDLFDRDNFDIITQALTDVKVYPGIELTLDIGHVNIVFPTDCVDELSLFSDWLSQVHQTQTDSISSVQLREQYLAGIKEFIYMNLGRVKEWKKFLIF